MLVSMVILIFSLVGCRSNHEPKLSSEGWARHYAIEYFERDTNYGLFATRVEKLDIVPEVIKEFETYKEEKDLDYSYELFRVIVMSNEGTEFIYLIFIMYEEPLLLEHYFEDKIIEVDWELVR